MADQGGHSRAISWLASAALLLAFGLPSAQAAPAVDKRSQAPGKTKAKPKAKVQKEIDGPAERLRPGTLGSFTPSILDPSRAATLVPGRGSAARTQTSERSFRFTPAGKVGDRKAVTLGITSRVLTSNEPNRTLAADGLTPSGYNVGLAVGYHGFSLSGGYTRLDTGPGPLPLARESVDLGLSYGGNSWKTSLQVGAEEGSDHLPGQFGLDRSYSVELGGAYALTPRLSLSGGVRYRVDNLHGMSTRFDSDRTDSSVYFGTALSF